MSKKSQKNSSKDDHYSPTSYFFDENKWMQQEEKSDISYRNAGLVIGHALRKIDSEFQSLLTDNRQLSEAELLVFQANYTAYIFNTFNSKKVVENSNQILEAITDGVALLLRNAEASYNGHKSNEHYISLLSLAVNRLYLEEKWRSVSLNRLKLQEKVDSYYFAAIDENADFGEKIAISRFEDHLAQISFLESGNKLCDPRIKRVPAQIHISNQGIEVSYGEPDEVVYNQSILVFSQVSFFYGELANISFKDYPNLTIIDLCLFWVLFSRLAQCFLNCFRAQTVRGLYGAFTKEELIGIFQDCVDIDRLKSEQLITIFTNSWKELKKVDLYIKPLYQLDDKVHLCLPSLVSGQFTRVADYFINQQVIDVFEDTRNRKKGWLFETGFTSELSRQISENRVLQHTFCKILKVGFKRKPGNNNEEIDIILRIGQTYLLIEAKSFIYRTGVMGFHNTYKEFLDSNLGQKKQFFIDEYFSFREKFDSEAQFEFNPSNVVCCYLSSLPHCVGTKINGFPVVDSSILERYFGNSNFLLRDTGGREKIFWFYKNGSQAERNLARYLSAPPQLSKFKKFFKYSKETMPFTLNGKAMVFAEPMFDLSYENEHSNALDLWEKAERWHLECHKASDLICN